MDTQLRKAAELQIEMDEAFASAMSITDPVLQQRAADVYNRAAQQQRALRERGVIAYTTEILETMQDILFERARMWKAQNARKKQHRAEQALLAAS